MRKIILNGNDLVDRAKAHEYLKEMLELPEYYGKNLDALYDCLTEMEETEVLIELTEEVSNLQPGFLKGVLRVFKEAAEENKNLKVNII